MLLTDAQLELLTGLAGTETLDAICARSILPSIEVCRALWAYRVIGMIRRLDLPISIPAEPEDDGLGAVLG
jgi:hypothetical protein